MGQQGQWPGAYSMGDMDDSSVMIIIKYNQTATLLAFIFLILGCQTGPTKDEIAEDSVKVDRNMGGLGLPRGLLVNSEDVAPGFVLFSPTNSSSSYLINRKGKVVHEWKGNFRSDLSSYLTGNGSLLRIAQDPDFPLYHGGGNAGRIQEFNWEGDMITRSCITI